MIRAIIQDISNIISRLKATHPFEGFAYHLDAEVKHYLHVAFLTDRIFDFDAKITQEPDTIRLNVSIREAAHRDWDQLGFAVDRPDVVSHNTFDAYDRAMRGI